MESSASCPELTYRPYDTEVIEEMKRLGMPRPDDCDPEDWGSPGKKLLHRHDKVIELLLAGWRRKEIAAYLGIQPPGLSSLMSNPVFQDSYEAARQQRTDLINKKFLDRHFVPAVETMASLLESSKESVQFSAASYIIDQAVGKAEQKLEHKGSMLSEVIHRIEQLRNRDVSESQALLATPDPLDEIVNEFAGGGFTVGVRSGTEECAREVHPGTGQP